MAQYAIHSSRKTREQNRLVPLGVLVAVLAAALPQWLLIFATRQFKDASDLIQYSTDKLL